MRVVLKIEYDGTDYCGWQIQPNGVTVQETIERAFFNATGEKIRLFASGRTDSGVHAQGQIAHFDTNLSQPAESFKHILNAVLPSDIKITDSFKAKDGFHARFSAKRKTYRYSAYVSQIDRPLLSRYSARVNGGFDVEKMKLGAKLIEGEHDFKCFCSADSSVSNTVRTIYSLDVVSSGETVSFTVTGNGFIYNMVRIIVGTLFGIGYGKISLSDLENALTGGCRELVGKTMPPNGLCLVDVEYE